MSLLLEGLNYKEIADVAGITVNYVEVIKISRMKQALEQLMTERSIMVRFEEFQQLWPNQGAA